MNSLTNASQIASDSRNRPTHTGKRLRSQKSRASNRQEQQPQSPAPETPLPKPEKPLTEFERAMGAGRELYRSLRELGVRTYADERDDLLALLQSVITKARDHDLGGRRVAA